MSVITFESGYLVPWPMWEGNTVFVLGAGASADYGLPLGDELTGRLQTWVDDFLRQKPEKHVLRNFNASQLQDMRAAARAMHQLGNADLFLARNAGLREVGKFCISRIIAQHEDPGRLEGGWYPPLFRSLLPKNGLSRARPSDLVKSEVAFITFNYDRSLEEALFHLTKTFFHGASDEECAQAIDAIPIIHVHGQLGRLPWQIPSELLNGLLARPYTPSLGLEDFVTESPIKIAEETTRTTKEYAIAQHLLLKAKRIHFLGFGFHDSNLSHLRFGPGLPPIQISGTHFRLGESVKEELEKSGGTFGIPIKFKGYPETVRDYFHNVIGG